VRFSRSVPALAQAGHAPPTDTCQASGAANMVSHLARELMMQEVNDAGGLNHQTRRPAYAPRISARYRPR